MARYGTNPVNPATSAQARGANLPVSFKNTQNVAAAIRKWPLTKAYAYLEAVTEKKRAIPFRRHAGSIGRTAQANEWGVTKARWPAKSVKYVTDLLKNAEANADAKGLDKTNLIISHIQVTQAPHQRQRAYRAHGRINIHQSCPSHIEVVLTEADESIPKALESNEVPS